MSDFPTGRGAHATRHWLDKKGFKGKFVDWEADALLGKSDEFIMSKFGDEEKEKGEMLCSFLNFARTQETNRKRSFEASIFSTTVERDRASSISITARGQLTFSFGLPQKLPKNVRSALDWYTSIGVALKDDENVLFAMKEISEIAQIREVVSDEWLPFVVVDAPSGSGKTQFSFALQAAGLNIVHLVLKEAGQTIYRAFESMSFDFNAAIARDFGRIRNKHVRSEAKEPIFVSDELSCDSLRLGDRGDSEIVRFVFELLIDRELCSRDELPSQQTIESLRSLVRELRKDKKNIPVFVLDEAIAQDDEEKAKLRLVRNVLRAAHLVVVLMGTNTCAYDLVTMPTGGRVSMGKTLPLWCCMITRLPKLNENTLAIVGANEAFAKLREKNHDKLAHFLNTHICTCLPYFVVLLAKEVNQFDDALFEKYQKTADLMDYLFGEILQTLRNDKSQPQSLEDEYQENNNALDDNGGLLSLLYNKSDLFVACRFARLADNNPKLYITSDSYLVDMIENPWERRTSFASPEEDPLLYLIFLGPHRYPDSEAQCNCS